MSLPRFLVAPDAVRDGAATVGDEELVHMRKVLRLKPGARGAAVGRRRDRARGLDPRL